MKTIRSALKRDDRRIQILLTLGGYSESPEMEAEESMDVMSKRPRSSGADRCIEIKIPERQRPKQNVVW